MDVLAFIHAATAYDDLDPVPERRSLDPLVPHASQAAALGLASVMSLTLLTTTPGAIAAVRLGDNGASVSQLQTALQRAGFDPGSVDGVFGTATAEAVMDFQRANRLEVDGIVGPQTAAALGISDPSRPASTTPTAHQDTPARATATRPDPAPSLTQGTPRLATVNTTGGVVIRATPGLDAEVINHQANGNSIALTGEEVRQDGYTWARLSGQAGWVAAEYLSIGTTRGPSRTPASATSAPSPSPAATSSPSPTSSAAPSTTPSATPNGVGGPASTTPGMAVTPSPTAAGTPSAGASTATPSPLRSRQARVTADALIVRSRPNGEDTGNTLYQGQVIQITGIRAAQGGRNWLELTDGNWVAEDYLLPIES